MTEAERHIKTLKITGLGENRKSWNKRKRDMRRINEKHKARGFIKEPTDGCNEQD